MINYCTLITFIIFLLGNNIGGSPQKIVLELKVANGVNLSHQRVGIPILYMYIQIGLSYNYNYNLIMVSSNSKF